MYTFKNNSMELNRFLFQYLRFFNLKKLNRQKTGIYWDKFDLPLLLFD